jgi:diguanylate cyclase (GGDEF)-like protein/hemerythrin-like metal-binding protein/PAS domain S-box-containing protein
MDKVGVGLAILDLHGRFREANPALCELTGYARADLLAPGFDLLRLCPAGDLSGHTRALAALKAGEEETYRGPWLLLRKDNLTVWVDLVIHLLRDGHAPQCLVATAIDITEQKRAEDTFRNLSYSDPLTKLANRRMLHERLHTAFAQAKREHRNLALLFIDLDGFKPINDRLGHDAGDWLLKAVAQRLLECIRSSDIAARFGGDEFVVLLPDLAQPDDAPRVAERIRAALAAPFVTEGKERLEISCSIGMSLYPDHAETDRELLHAGDEAMYLAKRAGRNRIVRSERTPTPAPVEEEASSGLVHLRWDGHYASGNAFIDAEHRELFRQANQLLDLLLRTDVGPPEVRTSLQRLMRAVAAHFKHEERLLQKWGFPDLPDHAYQHQRLLEHAEQIARILDDQTIPIPELLGFLVAEVIHGHILSEDRRYFHLAKGSVDG